MRIAVFGASGRVGSRVVELLLKQGHSVAAVVHSHDPFQGTPNLYVYKADVRDKQQVAKALKGADAVISCLSSWGDKEGDVLSSAMEAILPVMKEQGIRRIISLTGSGALTPEDKPTAAQRAAHDFMAKSAPKVLADGERHMTILRDSGLDWTVLRSPVMNNLGKPHYALKAELPGNLATINRQAVAIALVDQLVDTTWLHKAPGITRR